MKSLLSRFMLAGILAPSMAHAQSGTPPGAEIRLYEQPLGFVIGEERRVYTYYFNSLRTRMIGVEVTLNYPAAAAASHLSVGCQMTRPDGKVIEGIWKIGLSVQAGTTQAVGANTMFGPGPAGWQTGMHKVTCTAGTPLGETSFQMSPGPSLLADMEFRLKEVRFFATPLKLLPPSQRKYEDRFSLSETASIGIELTFLHPGGRKGSVPVDCYVLPSIARILGVMHETYEMEASATSGSVAMGIGWDSPGHWSQGEYLAVCQMHGRPIAVERFSVR